MSDRDRWERHYGTTPAGLKAPSELIARVLSLVPPGRALDLACGNGRNAVALARQGWTVDALDIAHAGLVELSRRAHVESLDIRALQVDLARYPLPVGRYDLVVNVRYLQRTLFAPIRRAVKPGGHVVFETFLTRQAELGHPRNPAFLLEPGELRQQFGSFEFVVDEEGRYLSEGHEAFLARILARRTTTERD